MSSPSESINEMDDSSLNKKRGRAHSVEPTTPQEVDNEANVSEETSSVTVSAPKKTKRDDEDNSTSIRTIRKNMKDMSTTDKNLTDTVTSESHNDETMSHISEEDEEEEKDEKDEKEKDEEMKQEDKEVKESEKTEENTTSNPFAAKFGGNGKEDDWGEFVTEDDDENQPKTKPNTTDNTKPNDTKSECSGSKYTFGASSGFGSKGWAAANQTVPSKPLLGGFGGTSSFGFKSLGSGTKSTTTATTFGSISTNNPTDEKTSTPSWSSFANATASPFAAIAASAGNALASSTDKSNSPTGSASTSTTTTTTTTSNANIDTETKVESNDDKDQITNTFGEEPKVKVPGVKQQTEVKTGEEDEDTVYQTRAKLLILDTTSGNWKERGVGIFRINVKEEEEKGIQSRLVMRTDSVYRLILNLLLFEGMKVFIMQDKFVRFAGFESETKEDGTVETKLVSFALKLKDAALAEEVCEQISSYIPSNASN
ncbi:MAG: hypothetical protein EXX96DRAFT_529209 [Benjaminiella poitrasii]|nr:MAG: hypothetical protein EXX96DRAFT_529209 [Benjaminiella poitrasii]